MEMRKQRRCILVFALLAAQWAGCSTNVGTGGQGPSTSSVGQTTTSGSGGGGTGGQGKACGTDSCGGSCGACPTGGVCTANQQCCNPAASCFNDSDCCGLYCDIVSNACVTCIPNGGFPGGDTSKSCSKLAYTGNCVACEPSTGHCTTTFDCWSGLTCTQSVCL
jgi:hypothetical protein